MGIRNPGCDKSAAMRTNAFRRRIAAPVYALARNDRLLRPLQAVFQAAAQPLERAPQGAGDGGFVDAQLLGDL